METSTIILLSVLSTLSVVSIITMIVVSFNKLNIKVDKLEQDLCMQMNNERTNFESQISSMCQEYRSEFERVRSTIDSRCDKLDSKIITSNLSSQKLESQKQILQG